MASKKNNALKRQQYGTPLPLPCLEQQPPSSISKPDTSALTTLPETRCSWTSLDPLFEAFRHLYFWSKTEHRRLNSIDHPGLDLIQAEFHPQGECVWVKKDSDMSTLFRKGFFGKGTLSRSEATWKQRNTADAQGLSLEEITRQRRVERAQMKAKKLQKENSNDDDAVSSSSSPTIAPPSPIVPSIDASPISNATLSSKVDLSNSSLPTASRDTPEVNLLSRDGEENIEHLQLSLEEAFFLVFAVECIIVKDAAVTATSAPNSITTQSEDQSPRNAMSIRECWLRFSEASTVQNQRFTNDISPTTFEISANNPFIVRYVVYHHYRSQGWIVKDGIKYGTDFLLYQKGMVFGHSQYAVRVVPCESEADINISNASGPGQSYLRPFMTPTPGMCRPHAALSWQWLLTLNRVVAQVQKTAILCHVVVPTHATRRLLSHPRTALPLYKVAEIGIKRFIPEKNRA